MPRKTHAIGFRLGTTQPNPIQLQCYGHTPSNYVKLAIRLRNLTESLERILARHMIYIATTEWIMKDSSFYLSCVYTSYQRVKDDRKGATIKWITKDNFKGNSFIEKLVPYRALNEWVNSKSFKSIKFYRVHWLHNPKTLTSWIKVQLEQKQPIKTVLKLLKRELLRTRQWNYESKSFISGSTKFHLAGIKISCRGRLRGKRQRMSNKVDKQLGVMPLQTLNAFVEYEKSSLCTRFGKIGIHVYYYYSKKEHV